MTVSTLSTHAFPAANEFIWPLQAEFLLLGIPLRAEALLLAGNQ
jgi:hypothetical protein